MSFKNVRKIPSPEEIIEMAPMSTELKALKAEKDAELKEIFKGNLNKFIVIIGPCSANDEEAVCDYMHRLKNINEKVKDKLFIIPRVYTNKPRTTGVGYKGMLHQPDPEKEPNMLEGVLAIRRMDIKIMEETGFPIADEMLYPTNLPFVEDLLTYIAIGARSVENQQHRLVSSGIGVPVGMKNPTSGDFNVMLNSIEAAHAKHDFIYNEYEVSTSGNEFAHAILRGSVSKHGENIPNYHFEDIIRAIKMYEKKGFPYPSIIIDTNHANSSKKYYEQPRIAREILYSRKYDERIKRVVKGFMIESYIEGGSQKIEEHIYGKSITDPCLGWEATEELLYYMAENV